MMCKENDKALAEFFHAMEQSLTERPLQAKSYASRVIRSRATRNPLRSYVASMRLGGHKFAG